MQLLQTMLFKKLTDSCKKIDWEEDSTLIQALYDNGYCIYVPKPEKFTIIQIFRYKPHFYDSEPSAYTDKNQITDVLDNESGIAGGEESDHTDNGNKIAGSLTGHQRRANNPYYGEKLRLNSAYLKVKAFQNSANLRAIPLTFEQFENIELLGELEDCEFDRFLEADIDKNSLKNCVANSWQPSQDQSAGNVFLDPAYGYICSTFGLAPAKYFARDYPSYDEIVHGLPEFMKESYPPYIYTYKSITKKKLNQLICNFKPKAENFLITKEAYAFLNQKFPEPLPVGSTLQQPWQNKKLTILNSASCKYFACDYLKKDRSLLEEDIFNFLKEHNVTQSTETLIELKKMLFPDDISKSKNIEKVAQTLNEKYQDSFSHSKINFECYTSSFLKVINLLAEKNHLEYLKGKLPDNIGSSKKPTTNSAKAELLVFNFGSKQTNAAFSLILFD